MSLLAVSHLRLVQSLQCQKRRGNVRDKAMTREEFKKQIEYPLNHFITNEDVHFGERNHIKATIGRTLRLALQYPIWAQEYLDSLPKATMD